MKPDECQFASLQSMGAGSAKVPTKYFLIKLGRFVKRHLNKRQFAALYKLYCAILFPQKNGASSEPAAESPAPAVASRAREPLKAGDWVRVLPIEEIEATLDHNGKTKGCGFMQIQRTYCGTVQRVFKSIERFVDERDFKVRKCKGLVMLEGVMCEGVEVFGRCDRACLIFWREEWLEKITDVDMDNPQ